MNALFTLPLLAALSVEPTWQASVSDGDVLRLDSSSVPCPFEWARYALMPKDASLRPNTRYEITFKAKVAAGDSGAYLYAIIRPLHVGGAEKDVGDLPVHPTDGRWQRCTMRFSTGVETDYRLQFHSHGRITAEVAEVEIKELPPLKLATITPVGGPVSRPDGLPTGAKEFDVDLPRPSTDLVLDAADFGVRTENADNAEPLRRALAAAKDRKAAKLVLAPGDYRLGPDSALIMDGFSDFTFDGRGARFVSSRAQGAFLRLHRCVRTRLVDFSVDWDWSRQPLASVVEVQAVGEGFVDLRFRDYDDFPNRRAAFLVLSPFDPVTRSVGVEGVSTKGLARFWGELSPFPGEWISPNVARLKTDPNGLHVGELYRLQHYYYHLNGFSMDSNEHLRLERVKILSTPGHAFLITGTQHHTLFDRVDIVAPKDDPRRVITCTADHLHVAQSRGYIKLDHCEFSLGGDDIFNMHDSSGFARANGPRTVRTVNAPAYGRLPKGTKVELRHGDYSPSGFIGTVAETKPVDGGGGAFDITFEEPIPAEQADGFVLFDRTYDTRNVIVRDSYFHDNRARGLLILARDVTVENNVFRHQEMGAIKIETGYTLNAWSEGYGVSNVVIRNNVFADQNPSGSNSLHRERTIYVGIYLKRDPSEDVTDYPIIRDLLFEGNTFSNSCGVAAYVTSARNVTFLNNVFADPTPRRHELPYRAGLYFANAREVRVLGCDFRAPSVVPSPTITYDPATCDPPVVSLPTLPELRVHPEGHYLMTAEERPFFWLGDTAWELFHRLNREEAIDYLANRAKLGYNVIQAVAIAELDGIDAPNAYGHRPFDFAQGPKTPQPLVREGPSDDYWDHVDFVVREANRRGLYVAMLPCWGAWWKERAVFTPESAARYGEWLGARYREAGVVWVLGGDRAVDTQAERTLLDALAAGLRKGDGARHLVSFHPRGGGASSRDLPDCAWLDFNMRQNGHGVEYPANPDERYAGTLVDARHEPAKPVIDAEPVYEGHPVSFTPDRLGHTVAADVRRAFFWDTFNGAFGHTYGHHSIWQMYDHGRQGINRPLMTWREALDESGARQLALAKRLFERRAFFSRVPAPEIIVPSDPASAVPGAGTRRFVATRDRNGSFAMVYAPVGRPFTVDLSGLKSSRVRIAWYDPRTGEERCVGTIDNPGRATFNPPTPGELLDWVLVADAE